MDAISLSFKGAFKSTAAAQPVLDALVQALSSTYTLSALARNAHWNIEGATFFELHGAFGSLYGDADSAADDLAERLRQLGAYVKVNLAAFQQAAGFAQPAAPQAAAAWVGDIVQALDKVIADLKALEKAADSIEVLEVQDLALSQAQVWQKHRWMFVSAGK